MEAAPGWDIPWLYYGVCQIQNQQYQSAIQTLSQLLEAFPNHPDGTFNLARAYAANGDFQPAETLFQQALSYPNQDPVRYGWIYFNLGTCTTTRTARERPFKFCKKGSKTCQVTCPTSRLYTMNWQRPIISMRITSMREKTVQYLIQLNPTYPDYYRKMSTILTAQGRNQEAQEMNQKYQSMMAGTGG
ncbi:MAG: tetratricopeptide repeat protein [Saprospirales bacterium]|nr:tetratricopeptide repeat protein [Saprospirales bacterium]